MIEDELAEVRNRRIGFVLSSQFNLLPSMAAWRNVRVAARVLGVPEPNDEHPPWLLDRSFG